MKLLYALQGTGNGHIARAQEIVPILKKYALVDVLISGHQSQLKPKIDIDYRFKGISLLYDNHGGLSYNQTLFKNNYCKAVKLIKNFNLDNYDLIINDFEPITAWAAKLKHHPIIALSHQAALSFQGVPKPSHKSWLGEQILKYYAPCKEKIGFHFEAFHPNVKTPVIRKEIRSLDAKDEGFYLVYLPSYSDEAIFETLSKIDVNWKVFSKKSKDPYRKNNVEFYPIDQKKFINAFANCRGVLCNAGFETPAEALYLHKKLFVIPIHNQYEQAYNASSLNKLGIESSDKLSLQLLQAWVEEDKHFTVNYPDNIENIIIENILKKVQK